MSTFALAPDGDILVSGRNLVLQTDRAECAATQLTNKFRMGLGEWFLDVRQGFPWLTSVLVKNPNFAILGNLFRRTALTEVAIVEVESISFDYTPAIRSAIATMFLRADNGAVITGGPGQPFIVVDTKDS